MNILQIIGQVWLVCALLCGCHYTIRALLARDAPYGSADAKYDVNTQEWATGILWLFPAWPLYLYFILS